MDITSVTLGKKVRDDLRDFRDDRGHSNYNQAVKDLLSQAAENEDLEVASA